MRDEKGFERFVVLDMGNLHKGLVPAPRPLSDLLLEDAPAAVARDGSVHPFDRAALETFHRVLSPLARRRLKLPATFYIDKELPADAYLQDAPAVDLLRALGEIPGDRDMRDGKLWLGLASAQAISKKYAGAFQFVFF